MHIAWHGHYTLSIQSGDTTLVLDPHSAATGLTPIRIKTDIVALSNPSDPTMSDVESLEGSPFVINTPGEFSVGGCHLHALSWHDEAAHERSLHRWLIEDLVMIHVGALHRALTPNELQELEKTNVDILLLPVGGGSGLNTKDALHLLTTLEPRIVIPIHYALPKLKEKLDDVTQFAKEVGVDPTVREKKLIVKANKLPIEGMHTVILAP